MPFREVTDWNAHICYSIIIILEYRWSNISEAMQRKEQGRLSIMILSFVMVITEKLYCIVANVARRMLIADLRIACCISALGCASKARTTWASRTDSDTSKHICPEEAERANNFRRTDREEQHGEERRINFHEKFHAARGTLCGSDWPGWLVITYAVA